jgi:hypothetical protein
MAQTWPWVNRFIVLLFRSLAPRASAAQTGSNLRRSLPHTKTKSGDGHTMFRVRYIAFSLAIVGVAASLPTDLAHARGQALKRHIHSASLGRKPARWCGWWMRTQKGGGPEMNLARNWARWGSPSGPRVGAVVVWPHHVGLITGQTASGEWIVRSGNDGGRVRERPARWPAPCSASNSPQRSPGCRARPGFLASNDEA